MKKLFRWFLVLVCSGFMGVILCTSQASARISPTKGSPGCQRNLDMCTGDLGTCTADLDTCNTDLGTCQEATCDNGIAEFGEACDGENLQGETCQSQGFMYGTLACSSSCEFDTTSCTDDRFVDNLDGTVTDNMTGRMWEKKTSSAGIHYVDDSYTWNAIPTPDGYPPDGTAFTGFLHKLNNTCDGAGTTLCAADTDCVAGMCGFVGYRDWRLPEVGELQTIVDPSMGACGGGSGACISPVFGPTAETPPAGICPLTSYWSSTYLGSPSGFTLGVDFMVGMVGSYNVSCNLSARAVRGGP